MRILIADDHPLFQDALELSVRQQWPDAEILCVGSIDSAAEMGSSTRFDLIVLDWRMPGFGDRDAITQLRSIGVEGPVAVVTGAEEAAVAVDALRCGANAFLPKTTQRRVLAQALRLVAEGGSFVPADIFLSCLEEREIEDEPGAGWYARPPGLKDEEVEPSPLTEREREVLGMLATGATNKEIARQLNLAEVTVKLHTRRILHKLGARNRTDAVHRAQLAGILGLAAAGAP